MGACACSSSRTSRRWRACSPAGCARRATRRTSPADGRGRALDGARGRLRRDRARRDAPGRGRVRDVPRLRAARRLVAGADADRAGRGRGPDQRPRRRRRRLPARSRSRSASCWPGCAPSSRRAPGERPTTIEVGDAPPRSRGAAGLARGDRARRCRRRSSRCSRRSCAGRARSLSRDQLLDAAWDIGVREPLEHRRRLRALPAREDRPALRPTRSRPFAGSATGCGRTRPDVAAADPPAADACRSRW